MNQRTVPALALLTAAVLLVLAEPACAGRWTPIGMDGGTVWSLAISPSAPDRMYAATAEGIFGSRDGGSTWAPLARSLRQENVGQLVIDPAAPDTLYARSWRISGTKLVTRISRTTDGGAAWSVVQELEGTITSLTIAPSAPNILYAMTNGGKALKSTDRGTTWSEIYDSYPLSITALTVDPRDANTVYLGHTGELLRSTDGGAQWSVVGTGIESETVFSLVVDPQDSATLYASTFIGLYKSTDRGAVWTPLGQEVPEHVLWDKVAIDPSDPRILYVVLDRFEEGREEIWKTTDAGVTWRPLSDIGYSSFRSWHLTVDPRGRIYLGLDRVGLLRSADGGSSWALANHGIRTTLVTHLAFDPRNPGSMYAAALASGGSVFTPYLLAKSDDGGMTWNPDFAGSGYLNVYDMITDPAGNLYIAGNGIRKSTDWGATWMSVPYQNFRLAEQIIGLALDPSQPKTLYALGFPGICDENPDCPQIRAYKSTDGGSTWRRSGKGLPKDKVLGTIAVDPVQPATVYVGGWGLYRSTDGGAHWKPHGQGLPGFILDLQIDPAVPSTLYAAVSVEQGRRIYKSTDGGGRWKPASNGIPGGTSVRDLVLDPADPSTLYAATDRGVFKTDDGGRQWIPWNEGLTEKSVLTVAVDPHDPGRLYAGTDGGGGLFVFSPD